MKKKTWYKVRVPHAWYPKPNDELIGEYVGSMIRDGQFGLYKVHLIKAKNIVRYVSGCQADDLFSFISQGVKVKLVFKGMKKSETSDREYKVFELFTEGEIELKVTA